MNRSGVVLLRTIPGLAFAATSSLAELAPIVTLLHHGASLSLILAAGLAYQTGGAMARWLPGKRSSWSVAILLAGALITFTPVGHGAWFLAIAALAWGLQSARRHHARARPDESPSTAQKRAARVVGFVGAAIIPFWVSVAAILACTLAACALRFENASALRPRLTGHPVEAVMILHQTHYFIYCYGLLLILSELAGGPNYVGLWFGLGWLTYLSAERLWSSMPLSRALILGHIFVALTLTGLAVFGRESWSAVTLWVLTGLGGGTVYCLSGLHRSTGGSPEALDLAEDIGHVGGAAIALTAALVVGLDAWALAGLGGLLALATIILFAAKRSNLPSFS